MAERSETKNANRILCRNISKFSVFFFENVNHFLMNFWKRAELNSILKQRKCFSAFFELVFRRVFSAIQNLLISQNYLSLMEGEFNCT